MAVDFCPDSLGHPAVSQNRRGQLRERWPDEMTAWLADPAVVSLAAQREFVMPLAADSGAVHDAHT